MVLMFLSITACGRAEDKQLKDEDTEEKYDIEYVFPDDIFLSLTLVKAKNSYKACIYKLCSYF